MHEKGLDPTVMTGVGRRVFRRSFFFETLWNYAKMQNIGFVLCIYPALERLYSNEQDKKQAIFRHLDQVNTHPCMGPLLVGLVSRLEHDLESSTVIPYRRRIMSALAAHGDRFFWTHLKPLAAVWGVFLVVLAFGSIAGSIALLTIYNVPQLLVRAQGFDRGWQEGLKILEVLKSPEMNAAILGMRALLSLGLGLVAGMVVLTAAKAPSMSSDLMVWLSLGLGLVGIAAAALVAVRKGFPFTALLYLAALAAVSMFMLFDSGIILG
jgi:mannose/fructose/N-acetylgalactosamine-specific phosphotransferase system component IID